MFCQIEHSEVWGTGRKSGPKSREQASTTAIFLPNLTILNQVEIVMLLPYVGSQFGQRAQKTKILVDPSNELSMHWIYGLYVDILRA